jgi:hypothetical protein
MAYRRKVVEKVGQFDANCGSKSDVLGIEEGSGTFECIISVRFKVIVLGGARMPHRVQAYHLTKRDCRRWYFQTSRNMAQALTAVGGG